MARRKRKHFSGSEGWHRGQFSDALANLNAHVDGIEQNLRKGQVDCEAAFQSLSFADEAHGELKAQLSSLSVERHFPKDRWVPSVGRLEKEKERFQNRCVRKK